jgi:hypothetical protein
MWGKKGGFTIFTLNKKLLTVPIYRIRKNKPVLFWKDRMFDRIEVLKIEQKSMTGLVSSFPIAMVIGANNDNNS